MRWRVGIERTAGGRVYPRAWGEIVTAAVSHRCEVCKGAVAPGERYWRVDAFTAYAICLDCEEDE